MVFLQLDGTVARSAIFAFETAGVFASAATGTPRVGPKKLAVL